MATALWHSNSKIQHIVYICVKILSKYVLALEPMLQICNLLVDTWNVINQCQRNLKYVLTLLKPVYWTFWSVVNILFVKFSIRSFCFPSGIYVTNPTKPFNVELHSCRGVKSYVWKCWNGSMSGKQSRANLLGYLSAIWREVRRYKNITSANSWS